MTILFADLVGFTERSDRADPEDVRRTLRAFHARAKQEIERFGGVVDKFIGDAVMGVFGAPVAHGETPNGRSGPGSGSSSASRRSMPTTRPSPSRFGWR